jgi:hypothetical protein
MTRERIGIAAYRDRGIERVRGERERERERRSVRHGEIMLVTIPEKRYVSEPIRTKYLKF